MFSVNEITQAPRIKEEKVRRILKDAWGIIDGDVTVLNGYEDMNFRISNIVWDDEAMPDQEAIFKITNPVAARNTRHLDFQRRVCEILSENDIPSPYYIPLKNSNKIWRMEKMSDEVALPIRLIRILPGTNLEHFPFDEETIVDVGRMIAKFHNVMDTIPKNEWESHVPFIAAENVDCSVNEVAVLKELRMIDKERAQLVTQIFDEVKGGMMANKRIMDTGLIHSDINDTNVLVEQEEDGSLQITGLIDMGDVHESLRIMDVGATCLYLALGDQSGNTDWTRFLRWIVRGYGTVRPLNDIDYLITAMKMRMACSLVCGLRAARINYRNEHDAYVLKTQVRGWRMLQELLATGATSWM